MIGQRIAHYEIQEPLGQGGMGQVWLARDLRLGRDVAIKHVRADSRDERMHRRLWREARAAASVNHPHVCQIYDVVEQDGELFLAMELLDGETLGERMARGAIASPEALSIARQVLSALESVHAAGLVHRDLKPANIVLTPHGVKLLDFGLSRRPVTGNTDSESEITRDGQAVGTPRYMSPEQWAGEGIGPSSDLFAAGAILYEMVAGEPAIVGTTIREVMEDCVRGKPPIVRGGPEVASIALVVARSLARSPAERYTSAREMADDLECVAPAPTVDLTVRAERATERFTRVLVLPFRLLRPDAEIEFLAFSLPDAIITSLSTLPSVVVCSSASVTDVAAGSPDVAAIARQVRCNAVVFGNILRAGRQVRVTSQLVEAPEGRILGAHTSEGTLDDIFALQDDIARDIVASLPLDGGTAARSQMGWNRPRSGKAYELYLRANQLANQRQTLSEARDLYRACLEIDPTWAPGWARLGRVYRVLAKYSGEDDVGGNFAWAEEAFRTALDLDPDLSVAHNLYTFLEVEELGRSRDAMVRLLERAQSRANDPQLFAGLVLTCRFCGLLEESLAADRRARHLDPGIRTSVHFTYQAMGEWEKAIEYDDEDVQFVTEVSLAAWQTEGQHRRPSDLDVSTLTGLERHILQSGRAAAEGRRDDCLESVRILLSSNFRDPEGRFYLVRNLCRIGEVDLAVSVLTEVVERGFLPRRILDRDPWLAPLRAHSATPDLICRMEDEIAAARASFVEAGGSRVLSVEGTAHSRAGSSG